MHFANFIKENRSMVCKFKPSGLSRHRTSKRSFFIPEQLTFQQTRRNRCAIHLHKRSLSPFRSSTDLTSHEFFAGTTLTSNQDGDVSPSNLINNPLYFSHLIAMTQNDRESLLSADRRESRLAGIRQSKCSFHSLLTGHGVSLARHPVHRFD